MDIYILNRSFEPVAVIDCYKSLIWTKRYYTCGDFELYVPADKRMLQYFQPDYFLTRDDDDSVMVIERLEIQTDVENGDYYIVSGRSLESVLARRTINKQTILNYNDVIQGLSYLVVLWAGDIVGVDSSMTYADNFKAQFTGDSLMDAVTAVCQAYGIGFKITLSGSGLILSFYEGDNVDVIFSPEFDNLRNSKYVFDVANYANYATIAGEGQGASRITQSLDSDVDARGLSIRQIYVDARDISSNDGEISSDDYKAMLIARGREKLAAREAVKTFEAEIEPQTSFKYKVDYNLGDIVTVTNEYGITANPRIVEIVESWDETGYTVIPTFDSLEINNYTIILRDSDGFILRDVQGSILTVKE